MYAGSARLITWSRMNRHGFIPVLLSALVVLCPFQCIFGCSLTNSDSRANDDQLAVSCGCCSHTQDEGDSPNGPIPVGPVDCPCGDCFCRGALPVDKLSDENASQDISSLVCCRVSMLLPATAISQSQVELASFLLSVGSSGQDMRAALSCWII